MMLRRRCARPRPGSSHFSETMGATINKAIADHTATDAEVSEMLAEVYGE